MMSEMGSHTQGPHWRRRAAVGTAVAVGFGIGISAAGWLGRAHAAETAAVTALAAGTGFAAQIAGKSGPAESISPDTIPAGYRLIRIVDTSSRVGFYVTQGETLSVGGQTFLLAYQVTLFSDADGIQKIARGQTLWLALINMSSAEIVDQMGPVPDVGTPPAPQRQQGQE